MVQGMQEKMEAMKKSEEQISTIIDLGE